MVQIKSSILLLACFVGVFAAPLVENESSVLGAAELGPRDVAVKPHQGKTSKSKADLKVVPISKSDSTKGLYKKPIRPTTHGLPNNQPSPEITHDGEFDSAHSHDPKKFGNALKPLPQKESPHQFREVPKRPAANNQ